MTRAGEAGGPDRARRRLPVAGASTIAVGVALVVAAAIMGWRMTRGVSEFGPAVAAAPASAAPAPAVSIAAGGLPSVAASTPPVRLRIAAIGIDATVVATGLNTETSEVDVPKSVDTVGWYRFGPDLAASRGSVVIAGHVDSATQGGGAFFRLRDLRPGDEVTVAGSDGATRTFSVVSREVFEKAAVPLDQLFARDGPPRLTLITCGGAFDASSRHYRDNVVVTAQPV